MRLDVGKSGMGRSWKSRFNVIFSESRILAPSRILIDIWCMYADLVSAYVYYRTVTVKYWYFLIEWVNAEFFAKIEENKITDSNCRSKRTADWHLGNMKPCPWVSMKYMMGRGSWNCTESWSDVEIWIQDVNVDVGFFSRVVQWNLQQNVSLDKLEGVRTWFMVYFIFSTARIDLNTKILNRCVLGYARHVL